MAKGNKVKSGNTKQTEPAGENVTLPATSSDNANTENQNADTEGSDVMDALGFNTVAAQIEGDRIIANQQADNLADGAGKAKDTIDKFSETAKSFAEPAPEPVGPTLRGPCPTPGCTGRLGSSSVQRVQGTRARVRYLICHTCGKPGGKETC